MRLLIVLFACALVVAATPVHKTKVDTVKPTNTNVAHVSEDEKSLIINILIRQLFELIRLVINQGSGLFGIPPLDPLVLEHAHINVPAVLINFELEFIKGLVTGIGDFQVHRSNLDLRELSFDIDISVPYINVKAEHYKILGDIYTAIPFYGEGDVGLGIKNFRFNAKLFLKQSDDEQSILIDRVENPGFSLEGLNANFSGIIGGGEDMDAVVNAIIEDIIPSYINRLNGAIGLVAGHAIVHVLNPILDQLDSWRYIDVLL